MTQVLGRLVDAVVAYDSHDFLRSLIAQVGEAGLAAAAALPWLRATVDQHAAAVRDTLTPGVGRPTVVALAGSARGLLAGSQPPAAAVDWLTSRVLAVCWLAGRADAGLLVPELAA